MVIDKCGSCHYIMRKRAVYTLLKSIQPPFILVLLVVYKIMVEPRNGFNTF
nr:MAG TPA: hypothetical protein [Caudoviricetes sp.]